MNYLTRFKDAMRIYSVEKAQNLGSIKPSAGTIRRLKLSNLKKYISKK